MKVVQKTSNLTQTSKAILKNFMVRKSLKQKSDFIEFIKKELKDTNFSVSIENYNNKETNRNIIIGNYHNAKYIYTAHYDTCASLGFLPNFITPKNIVFFLFIQILIGLLLVVPALFMGFLLKYLLEPYGLGLLGYEVGLLGSLFLIIYMMLYGIPNKNNYNDNTSGVITIIEMIKKVPFELADQFCFILFDNEEKGLLGSKAFYKQHQNDGINNKYIINFDCVSDGDNLLFIHKNIDCNLIDSITKYQNKGKKQLIVESHKKAIFPSDHKKFANFIGVGAFNKNKTLGLYLGRIHTYRDIIFDEDNIFLLRDIFLSINHHL